MNFIHHLIARFHPCLPLHALPIPLTKATEFTPGSAAPEVNDQLTCVELKATWESNPVVLFVDQEMIVGVRYDLALYYGVLRALLLRSAKKCFGRAPETLLDRSPTYVAKLAQNIVTISGYTGSIGLWTEALHARMHAPKHDPIATKYKDVPGYSLHWKVRNDENIEGGVLEVYLKYGTNETLLGKSLPLASFDLDLVLIRTDSVRCLKLLADGKELAEISLGEFSFPREEGWHSQGAVYRSNDLYILWHTSIVDFRNAFGYKLVK